MNAAGSSANQHVFGHHHPNPITFGQVAAHAETFSQLSTLPTSFGNYDSFYMSLRHSENVTRHKQQKQWLRRHRYRGDERVRHGVQTRHKKERELNKYPASPFSSPEKGGDDVYEDDDIEAERYSCDDGMSGTEDIAENMNIGNQQFCRTTQVSPASFPDTSCIDLQPKLSNDVDHKQNKNLESRKRALAPMDLDQAFMELTLDMNPSLVTPDATSIGDNLKALAPADDEVTEFSTSVEPVVASRSSSLCSNLNSHLDSINLGQHQTSEKCHALYSSPIKTTHSEGTTKRTPVSNSSNNSPSTLPFSLTPLSKAIVNRRGYSLGSTKISNSPSILSPPTATPKRKPRGSVSSSSKRRRRNSNISPISASLPAPRQLYNGKAIERIRDVRRCTDKNCRWNPNLHKLKSACERCWMLASESERNFFVENGGRHIRINLAKGGCPSSCKLFSHRVKLPIDGSDDEDIRLCRKCFDDLHHVGIRIEEKASTDNKIS